MKANKTTWIVFTFVLLLALSACGSSGNDTVTGKDISAASEEKAVNDRIDELTKSNEELAKQVEELQEQLKEKETAKEMEAEKASTEVTEEPTEEQENETAEEKPQFKDESEINKSEFLFWDSDRRFLKEDEVSQLDALSIQTAINEIYARHGRIWSNEWNDYFLTKSWYEPKYTEEEFSKDVFNEYEKDNVDLLAKYRAIKNGEIPEQDVPENDSTTKGNKIGPISYVVAPFSVGNERGKWWNIDEFKITKCSYNDALDKLHITCECTGNGDFGTIEFFCYDADGYQVDSFGISIETNDPTQKFRIEKDRIISSKTVWIGIE